jgi:cell division protein FtsX
LFAWTRAHLIYDLSTHYLPVTKDPLKELILVSLDSKSQQRFLEKIFEIAHMEKSVKKGAKWINKLENIGNQQNIQNIR